MLTQKKIVYSALMIFMLAGVNKAQIVPDFSGWSQSEMDAYTNRQVNQMNATMTTNSVNLGGGVTVTKEQAAAIARGRARIKAGKASLSFNAQTPANAVALLRQMTGNASAAEVLKLLDAARLTKAVEEFHNEVRAYGYRTDDYVDMVIYGAAVIYEADFGKFPPPQLMAKQREELRRLSLNGAMMQGYADSFHTGAYEAAAGAITARYWKSMIEKNPTKGEIEAAVNSIERLEKLFRQNMAEDIYVFAGAAARERGLRADATFKRQNRELARGWYEKEYAQKFGRTDLDYAALLKEFDSIVTDMGGATNDGADGELAAAALVYEVYLDSQKLGYQLNENHLRDLRQMIARNYAEPFWSESADIWRQRGYEQFAIHGMFINKAYFSAKTAAQKKALADEALKVLKIVFRGKMNEYYIDANGIGRR